MLDPLPLQSTNEGRRTIRVYVAGSTAVMNLLTLLGVVAFKLGATGFSTAWARIEDLRHKSYAGLWQRPNDPKDPGRVLRGGGEWNMVALLEKHLKGMVLPANITLEKGCIVLSVPSRFTADDVNREVHARLRLFSLRPELEREEHRKEMAKYGYDPAGWFHTPYDRMTRDLRISAAEELYIFKPRKQLPWLIGMLAEMVAEFDLHPHDIAAKSDKHACHARPAPPIMHMH